MKRRCPFCHQEIFFLFFPAHFRNHRRARPDGQQKDHFTVAPAQRYEGSLDGVPRVYRCARCGERTQMPEEIVRSYLADPFLYNGTTFCCGCHKYVPMAEVQWVETQERLADYMKRLQQEARGAGEKG